MGVIECYKCGEKMVSKGKKVLKNGIVKRRYYCKNCRRSINRIEDVSPEVKKKHIKFFIKVDEIMKKNREDVYKLSLYVKKRGKTIRIIDLQLSGNLKVISVYNISKICRKYNNIKELRDSIYDLLEEDIDLVISLSKVISILKVLCNISDIEIKFE